MINNRCKGCTTYVPIETDDQAPDDCSGFNFKGGCPCTKCIVKSMCIIMCDPYKSWYELIVCGWDEKQYYKKEE